MTEFEKQLAARMQAHDFLLKALIRGQLSSMTKTDAAQSIARLEQQFATLSISTETDPSVDLDEAMSMHADAQFFLRRMLHQADPHDRDGTE